MNDTLTSPVEVDLLNLPAGTRLGTAIYVGDLADGSEAWHAQRANVIGSSDVAGVLGIPGAFKSAYALWMEKSSTLKPLGVSADTQELFDWGHVLEDAIAEMATRHLDGLRALKTGSWVHESTPWHGVNPDRVLVDEAGLVQGLLELKYSVNGSGWEHEECPHKYVAQLRYQLQAYGLPWGYLACMFNGKLLLFKVSTLDTEPIANVRTGHTFWLSWSGPEIVEKVRQFVETLPNGDFPGAPPQVTLDDDAKSYLAQQNPEIEQRDVEVTPRLANEYQAARLAADAATARLKQAQGALLEAMGKAKTASIHNKVLARRQATKGGSISLYANGKPWFIHETNEALSLGEVTDAPVPTVLVPDKERVHPVEEKPAGERVEPEESTSGDDSDPSTWTVAALRVYAVEHKLVESLAEAKEYKKADLKALVVKSMSE